MLLFVSLSLKAQYTSRLGRFQVDQKKGCAPFTITITDTNLITTGDCTPGKPCNMDYEGNGQQQQNVFTYTYTKPGTYKLSVLYQSIGADDITVTVVQNIQPAFDVYSCAGSKVAIKVTDTNYDQYVIDFTNDGVPEFIIPITNNLTQYNYGSPGGKVIKVRGRNLNSADNCSTTSQNFTALTTLPVTKINVLTTVDDASIKLDFNQLTAVQLKNEISVNSGSTFQFYQSVYEVNTQTIPNLKTDDNYYCFRLSSFDPCANTNVYSNTICSHNFDLSVQSGVNKLTWTTSTSGTGNVEIMRNKASYSIIPGAPLSFNDVDAVCKTDYCYQVISHYSNGAKSISLEKCGTAFNTNTPPAIDNVTAVVGDGGVELTWPVAPKIIVESFNVTRTAGKGEAAYIPLITEPKYTDASYATGLDYCYYVNYTDNCGNLSAAGTLVCPMQLSGTLEKETNIITIGWSSYKGWKQGVKLYEVYKYGKDGNLIKKYNVGTDTTFTDDQPDLVNQLVTYKIIATPVDATQPKSISNTLSFIKEIHLYSPTAFTPNKDKLNDNFTVSGQFIVKLQLKIFDRWGNLIFSSEKGEPWDGTFNGKAMPETTYIWKADITDLAGQNFVETGTIMLIEKGK